jgi:hypothetical protein
MPLLLPKLPIQCNLVHALSFITPAEYFVILALKNLSDELAKGRQTQYIKQNKLGKCLIQKNVTHYCLLLTACDKIENNRQLIIVLESDSSGSVTSYMDI